jgi:hypothetical protein
LPLDGLSELEVALIRLGREALQQHAVTPATFADALRLFGPERLQDYVSLMSEYVATAVLLTVFNQQLPPGRRSALP